MIGSLARRLKGGSDQGFTPDVVFNTCQDHLVAAASPHIERVVHDAFARAVDRCEDPDTAAVLGSLRDLNALWTIEQDRAFYLEHGRLSAARTKAITRALGRLLDEVGPHALTLVDAFGIPERQLAAPIAIESA
jgi:acyl-CoA oxidase